jgi:hypothetical protein
MSFSTHAFNLHSIHLEPIRRHIPNTSKIMAVVKANAYGHGSVEVARQALENFRRIRNMAADRPYVLFYRIKVNFNPNFPAKFFHRRTDFLKP